MRQYWVSAIPPFDNADGSINTFTAATDASPSPQIVIPANTLEIGSTLRLRAHGNWSSTGTPNFTFGFYYGGVAGIALAIGAAVTTASGAVSQPWWMEWEGRVRSTGSSGSIVGQGFQLTPLTISTFNNAEPIPLTLALRTVTIDTTAAKAITVGAACSASSASNIFVVNNLTVELVS